MVEVQSVGGLTQVFATTTSGKRVRLASQRAGGTANRGLYLYDAGDGLTRTSRFYTGCGGEQAYKLTDSPQAIVQVFKDANLPVPPIRSRVAIGMVYRLAHRVYRVAAGALGYVDSRYKPQSRPQ